MSASYLYRIHRKPECVCVLGCVCGRKNDQFDKGKANHLIFTQQHLLSDFYVPDTMLGAGNTKISKIA